MTGAAAEERVTRGAEVLDRIRAQVGEVIVGQEALIDRLLLGLLAGGHLLLEGVPGLAKSLACETLAKTIDLNYRRIQFTPDLLPADIVGTPIFQPSTGRFEVKKGPVFTNVLLADEVNRAPAKVHSALLEAMQERAVTIGEETFKLEEPFVVLATQNPIEQEGTYPLPEAELDRFFLKVILDYPNREEESEIVRRMARTAPLAEPEVVCSKDELLAVRRLVDDVYIDERLVGYVLDIVRATRDPSVIGLTELAEAVRFGGSPRASIALVLAARTRALMLGRAYATPSDVKHVAGDVLRHRILLSYDAQADGVEADDVVTRVLDRVEVP